MTMFRLSDSMAPSFHSVHDAIRRGDCGEALLFGGRGSAKSSFVSMELILQLIRHPNIHAVILRKRENRLRTSVYAQMQWAVEQMGLGGRFKMTVSPMEMLYIPSGQKILFFGMDDPEKIKSIKAPFGHFGLLWFEEYDQFGGPEEVRSVEQSVLRGGDYSLVFKTFNPPQAPSHWANLELNQEKKGRVISRSCYLDVPEKWLGKRFLEDARHLAEKNPRAYEHEYLGLANGSGGQVFHNITLRKIHESEREKLSDRLYRGIDWGWYPDPFVYEKMAYLPGEERLFLLDEISGNRLSNTDICRLLRQHGVRGGDRILCDSGGEGLKSAAELRSRGFHVQPAQKGPGSVDYSMKWLASLREIVIDPETCPLAADEFSRYEFEKGRDGSYESGFPDRDNHAIDSVRYGLERIWQRPFHREKAV